MGSTAFTPPIGPPGPSVAPTVTTVQGQFRQVLGAYAQVRNVLTITGIRTVQVFVVKRVWQGGRRSADGGFVDEAVYQGGLVAQATGAGNMWTGCGLEVVPRPKCRLLSSREIFDSGGVFHEGALEITYIQPWWTGSDGVQYGYTVQDVAPDPPDNDGVEYFYVCRGSIIGEYYRVGSVLEKWGYYRLRLDARRTTPTKNGTP